MNYNQVYRSDKILHFYNELRPDFCLPVKVDLLNPFENGEAMNLARTFYHRYYQDNQPRILLFGINPGRFGAGVTGIPFTDPIRLKKDCGIENKLDKRPELSSEFIYEMIGSYGGADRFYKDFFVTAVCPLGFTLNGKNLNYYDDKILKENVEPFIVKTIRQQKVLLSSPDICFCLGKGKNFKYFTALNKKERFFKSIIPLPHPRWVMQYRRKKKAYFIDKYVLELQNAVNYLK